mmetsp:Transcript_31586/g.79216  ORF Transcript_31586/g.79216 Transcript_31586/m.79216 type:complete len:865 (+) Transcript_31586:113-2707(+)|eukprot:CAMPEP_0177644484 /NCGR_PEP_ID=MMETSP0447-20121125/8716_1 /TAXON_ID=0 /ORGANISM="Stygamoeba regulata, Strain BSH-02190019" /LENGTH=864 /DNA_ID=CAMNT_0019146855 /DNA_START=107 /DNA_END=2701 /DNA_ORIENTATION=+
MATTASPKAHTSKRKSGSKLRLTSKKSPRHTSGGSEATATEASRADDPTTSATTVDVEPRCRRSQSTPQLEQASLPTSESFYHLPSQEVPRVEETEPDISEVDRSDDEDVDGELLEYEDLKLEGEARSAAALEAELALLHPSAESGRGESGLQVENWARRQLILIPDEQGRKQVQAGTLADLLSHLLDGPRDLTFRTDFFYMYSYYMTPGDLLALLTKRYLNAQRALPTPAQVDQCRAKIAELIRHWLANHFYDFDMRLSLMTSLVDFLKRAETEDIADDVVRDLMDFIQRIKILRQITKVYIPYTKRAFLKALLQLIGEGVVTRTQKYHLRSHTGFVATEAVDFISSVLEISRSYACSILGDLVTSKMIKRVVAASGSGKAANFEDDKSLYKIKVVKKSSSATSSSSSQAHVDEDTSSSARIAGYTAEQEPKKKDGRVAKTLLDFHPLHVAQALTTSEQEPFRKVIPRELMKQRWNKKDAKRLCPNLVKLINKFNEISYWVATMICRQKEVDKRVAIIKRIINISDLCRQLKNYSTMMELVVGLNLSAVSRLADTWSKVPKKYIAVYDTLMNLTSASRNYKNYREQVHIEAPPLIPYIGVYLRDLTFIEDGNDSYLDSKLGLINWEKATMLSAVFQEITRFQRSPYRFPQHVDVQKFLANAEIITNDEKLRQLSLDCEISRRHSYHFDSEEMQRMLAEQQEAERGNEEILSPRHGGASSSAEMAKEAKKDDADVCSGPEKPASDSESESDSSRRRKKGSRHQHKNSSSSSSSSQRGRSDSSTEQSGTDDTTGEGPSLARLSVGSTDSSRARSSSAKKLASRRRQHSSATLDLTTSSKRTSSSSSRRKQASSNSTTATSSKSKT